MGKGYNTIFILGLILAFIAGTLTTGTLVSAAPGEQGQPFQALQQQVDSFFDIFFDQSCETGFAVTGIDKDGSLICALDQQGALGDLQAKIDEKKEEIEQFQSTILSLESSRITLVDVLVAIDPIEVLECELLCVVERIKLRGLVETCFGETPEGQDPDEFCAEEIEIFRNFECTCDQESEQIRQEISDLDFQLKPLQEQMLICKAELLILEELQNQIEPIPPQPTD